MGDGVSHASATFACPTENFGLVRLDQGGLSTTNNAAFTNRLGGRIDWIAPWTLGATLVNEGVISATTTANTTRAISGTFTNQPTGTVQFIGPGALALALRPDSLHGTLNIAGALSLTSALPSQQVTLPGDTHLVVGGRLAVSSGSFLLPETLDITAQEVYATANGSLVTPAFLGVPIYGATSQGTLSFSADGAISTLRIESGGQLNGAPNVTVTTSATLNGNLAGAGRLILGPACATFMDIATNRVFSRNVENNGPITFSGGSIQLNGATFLNNASGTLSGTFPISQALSIAGSSPAILRNLGILRTFGTGIGGTLSITGALDQQGIVSVEIGVIDAAGATLVQRVGDSLNGGAWSVGPGCVLSAGVDNSIKAIGPGTSITLNGPLSFFPTLSNTLRSIGAGASLTLRGGRDLALVPNGGTFRNFGVLDLGRDSDLTITGAFEQAAGGRLQVDFGSLTGSTARIAASGTASLAGFLGATLSNGLNPAQGTSLLALSGASISGRFTALTLPGGLYLDYTPTSAILGRRCPADNDDGSGLGHPDGGITIDDLLHYLDQFQSGDVYADLDDGGGTGTRDGGITIDDLLYFLARYDAGC